MSVVPKIAVSWQSSSLSPDRIDGIMGFIYSKKGTLVRRIEKKREVWRVRLAGETFYVKRYRYGSFARLSARLNLKGLGREVRIGEELEKRGISVPTFVAYGRVKGILPKEEYLITREVPESRTVKEFLCESFEGLSCREKKGVVKDLARFFRKLHDAGAVHSDPHAGNILISRSGGNNRFYLLDFGNVRVSTPLELSLRLWNLAQLNTGFITNTGDHLRHFFFRNYARGLIEEKEGCKEAVRRISEDTRVLSYNIWKKKGRRCMENNKLFKKKVSGAFVVHIKRRWDGVSGMQEVLASPDVFLENGEARILKDGNTVKAGLVKLVDGRKVFLKRYNRKGYLHTLKNSFRHSRARKVWKTSYGDELRGIKVPEPIAYMEERTLRVLRRSYVVSEYIDGAVLLSEYVGGLGAGAKDLRGGMPGLMSALGMLIGRMHRFGFFHGDLKWSNILVREAPGGMKEFYFTDIDGGRIKKVLPPYFVFKDVGRFCREMERYSMGAEGLRAFLSAYSRQQSTGLAQDDFIKAVAKRVRVKG
jgi:tRNA A-37 threonylcarbamoyl transferase component Bud32